MGITQRELVKEIHVPYQRFHEIINKRRGVTPSTALHLGKFFGVLEDFWMNLQLRLDICKANLNESKELKTIRNIRMVGVDGRGRRGWDANTAKPVLIDPGVRVLEIGSEYIAMLLFGYADVELKADLQAAYAYQFKIARNGRLLTFWLEDMGAHSEVSDRQTKEASIRLIVGGLGNNF